MRDGPSINDYWREFLQEAKVAYNEATAHGDPMAVVEPPSSVERRWRDRPKMTPIIESERIGEGRFRA
jgi:hypothetical protein